MEHSSITSTDYWPPKLLPSLLVWAIFAVLMMALYILIQLVITMMSKVWKSIWRGWKTWLMMMDPRMWRLSFVLPKMSWSLPMNKPQHKISYQVDFVIKHTAGNEHKMNRIMEKEELERLIGRYTMT